MSGSAHSAHGVESAPAFEPLAGWRKSSWSAYNGNCVEVAELRSGGIAVRDSKDRQGPVLVIARSAWLSFLDRAKAGPLGS